MPAGQHEDIRLHLIAVLVGERLHGWRVARFHGCLQLRKIGDQTREAREGVGQAGAVLVDQDSRLVQAPAQLRLRLTRRTRVHVIEGKAERQRRQQRARDKDPVRERGRERH